MLHLLENFILGFAITAIPGAVFFETLRRALTPGGRVSHFVLGNFLGMFVVIGISFSSVGLIVSTGKTATAFFLVNGLLLIYMGIMAILKTPSTTKPKALAAQPGDLSALVTGIVLAGANPISIMFWMSVYGKHLAKGVELSAILVNSVAIVLGALAFFMLFIQLAGWVKNSLSSRHLAYFSYALGLILCAYGLATLFTAFSRF